MTLGFLNPGALWLLMGLAIPIAIHLLHRGQSQRVLVGSVRFLKGRETQTLRRLKLTERRLLALRLLLLTLLAFWMAKPFYQWQQERDAPAGWLLLDPRLADTPLTPELEDLWDQAANQSWRISWLAPGFPAHEEDVPTPALQPGWVWSLAAEAAAVLPDDRPLHVVTPGWVNDFVGKRPTVAHEAMGWHHVQPETSERRLLGGYRLDDERVVLLMGELRKGQWHRERHLFSWDGQSKVLSTDEFGEMSIELDGDIVHIQLKGDDAKSSFATHQVPNRIAILTEDLQAEDVRLLRLALEMVAEFYAWPLEIQVAERQVPLEPVPHIVFALGLKDEALPDSWKQHPMLVFSDAGQQSYDQVNSAILWEGKYPGDPPLLARRVSSQSGGTILWRDTLGQSLLEQTRETSWQRFRFASKFLPQWSQLAHHQAFPMWLAEFLEDYWLSLQPRLSIDQDLRVYDPQQVRPFPVSEVSVSDDQIMASLSFPLWCLLMAVFVIERWWSLRRRAQ